MEAAASASSALGGENAAIGDGSEGSENPDGQSGKKKKNRCFSCKKKVGLTGKLDIPLSLGFMSIFDFCFVVHTSYLKNWKHFFNFF